MPNLKSLFLLILLVFYAVGNLYTQNNYTLLRESRTIEGTEYGEHIFTQFKESEVFPGTIRNVDIYVPADYDGITPACVCVFQDGMTYNADTVVSNMIESKELPMMILIAASPGYLPGTFDLESPRANRTYEYDTPSPHFGEFIVNELLPFVETLKTSDGRAINLSKKKEDRMITGCSSGAACAFNVAWNSNAFSRVYSACGSFTGLRGSFANATLVYKYEPKMIRFFFQSGTEDMWTSFGDWWSANQVMIRAMEFSGYDFNYKLTEGAHHCDGDATRIFPDVMRYLWKDYPYNNPQPKQKSRNSMMNQILLENKEFEEVININTNRAKLVANDGNIFLTTKSKTWILDKNLKKLELILNKRLLTFGKGKTCLAYSIKDGLEILDENWNTKNKIRSKIKPQDAVSLRNGRYYIIGNDIKKDVPHSLWSFFYGDSLILEDENIKDAKSLGLSANDNWLYIFEYNTRRGYSYQIQKDRSKLKYKQEFFYIHIPENADGAEVTSAISDNYGRTYLATACGIQICDYNGRSEVILTLPDNVKPISIAWGGKGLNYLYVLGDNNVIYRRELNTEGSSIDKKMPLIRVGAG